MHARLVVVLAALALAAPASASPGDIIIQVGSPGAGEGQLASPWGSAAGLDGSVYVTDTANHRVQVFSRAGAFLRSWGSLGAGQGQLDGPTGIAVCEPYVYVSDTNNDRVQQFDTAGNFIAAFGGVHLPHGLACDGSILYVADTGNHRILAWADWYDGFEPPYIPNGGFGSGPGQYDAPTAVALGPDGTLYVADTGNDRVLAVAGSAISYLGGTGSGDGQLSAPTGIAVDTGGHVYVTDHGNGRIEVFGPSGAFLTTFGAPGAGAGQLASPSGIAWDAGGARVVVTDSGNDRLQAFRAMTADLALTSFVSPAAGDLRQTFTVQATVRNLGPGWSGFSSVSVVRSVDAVKSSNDVPYCSSYVPSLSPGAEQPVTFSCWVPYDEVPGPYFLIAQASPANGIVDPDVVNATAVAPFRVNGPDLAVTSVSAPTSVGTLQSITLGATVVNPGTGTAQASTLRFSIVSDVSSVVGTTIGDVPIGALAPGAQQFVTATLTLPANLGPGTYRVRAFADAGYVLRELNESNNTAHSDPLVVGVPDLVSTALWFPAAAPQGATTTVNLTIANQGTGGARAFWAYVVLTRDGGVCTTLHWCDDSDDDWFLGSFYVSAGLAAGAQQTVSIPMTIPADFVPLAWNVFSVLDPGYKTATGNVVESNEANNTSYWGSIQVVPGDTTVVVGIDIKPGSSPNSINLGSNGVVPVAILSSATFDAASVDPLSVTLSSSPIVLRGNGTPSASLDDVNGDGLLDLVVQVSTEALQLTSASTSAALQGRTYLGVAIAGTDDVNIVP